MLVPLLQLIIYELVQGGRALITRHKPWLWGVLEVAVRCGDRGKRCGNEAVLQGKMRRFHTLGVLAPRQRRLVLPRQLVRELARDHFHLSFNVWRNQLV